MWIGAEIATYASLVLGYVLLLVLAIRNRTARGRAQRLLEFNLLVGLLWTFALGLLALFSHGEWWAWVWHRTAQVGLVLLALLTTEFTEAFVGARNRRRRLVIVAVLLSAVAVLDLWPFGEVIVLSPFPGLRLGPTEMGTLLLFLTWSLLTVAAWRASILASRRAIGSKHRNRIRYLQACFVGLTVGDLLVFSAVDPAVYSGLTVRLLGLSVIVLALLRYDLPDLRRLTLVLLRVFLLTIVTAALYLVVLLGVGLLLERSLLIARAASIVPFLILAVFFAAVADVALAPRLHRFFDRLVLGQRHDVQRALRGYGQQINLILDLDRLADTTLAWLEGTLRARRSAFILLTPHQGQHELRVLRSTVTPVEPIQLFAGDSRFIVHFRNIGRPLSQYDLDMLSWFQDMAVTEREWLRSLEVDLYVPISVADKPVALLALGPKSDGQPYSQQDLETLMILAGQAGTAVENARLIDDLRTVQGDIRRLNSELAETNRQLTRLDQAKTDFVTIASHELRTPLSQITGYSDVLSSLEEEELGDAQMVQQVLVGIASGAARIKRVVDAMVDMSLIETSDHLCGGLVRDSGN
jgi:GAF domain-containing protein